MPCCDDPGCPYCGEDAQVCPACGEALFGWENELCDLCSEYDEDELQTPHAEVVADSTKPLRPKP